MPMGSLIIHTVVAIVGLRLGLYSFMEWKRLRLKRAIASSGAGGWDTFFLFAWPVLTLLMAALVINNLISIVRMMSGPAL